MAARSSGKRRQEGLQISLSPSPPDLRQDRRAILLHMVDNGAGRTRTFVSRSPNEQFQEHRRQANAFFREPVVLLAGIHRIALTLDNAGSFQPL